jgi:uncharacterized protein YkvS
MGLNSDIKLKILNAMVFNICDTTDDLFAIVEKINDNQSHNQIRNTMQFQTNQVQYKKQQHKKNTFKGLEKITKQMNDLKAILLNPNNKNKTSIESKEKSNQKKQPKDLTKIKCYNCHNFGHYASSCRTFRCSSDNKEVE